jgi:Mn2+/Fe2+ NRAMP family transporter
MAQLTHPKSTTFLWVSIVYAIVFTALGEYVAFRVAFNLVLNAYL